MRIFILPTLFLFFAALGGAAPAFKQAKPRQKATPQDVRPALRKAGQDLRQGIRESIALVLGLDQQARASRATVSTADRFLFQVSVVLTQKRSAPSILAHLQAAQSAVDRGLQLLSRAPAPCIGATQERWKAVVEAKNAFSSTLERAEKIESLARENKNSFDRAVSPYLRASGRTPASGAETLAQFQKKWRQDLSRISALMSKAEEMDVLLRQLENSQSSDYCGGPALGKNSNSFSPSGPKGLVNEPAATAPQGGKKPASTPRQTFGQASSEAEVQPAIDGSRWRSGEKFEYVAQSGPLFASNPGDGKEVSTKGISQGHVNDCFFLVALAGIAEANPKAVKNMVKENSDGTYSVTFYRSQGQKFVPETVRVDNKLPVAVSDGQYYGVRPAGDLYPAVFEKAYAKWKGSYGAINLGSPTEAMQELTGFESLEAAPAEVSLRDLAGLIKQGGAITIGTKYYDDPSILNDPLYSKKPGGRGDQTLIPRHAYWVERIDPVRGTVLLRNPWGWGDARILLTEEQFQKSLEEVQYNPVQARSAGGS